MSRNNEEHPGTDDNERRKIIQIAKKRVTEITRLN